MDIIDYIAFITLPLGVVLIILTAAVGLWARHRERNRPPLVEYSEDRVEGPEERPQPVQVLFVTTSPIPVIYPPKETLRVRRVAKLRAQPLKFPAR